MIYKYFYRKLKFHQKIKENEELILTINYNYYYFNYYIKKR